MGELRQQRDSVTAATPAVLAFLFGFPDGPAMQQLTARRHYFDIRSGNAWDLFFPGYYRYGGVPGGKPVGAAEDHWGFSEQAFDDLRRNVEAASEGRWTYSGDDDLVLICSYLVPDEDPVIDWLSTQGGPLGRLNLAEAIERLSRDLERGLEDDAFGVADVVRPPLRDPPGGAPAREFMASVVGDILGALAAKAGGLN